MRVAIRRWYWVPPCSISSMVHTLFLTRETIHHIVLLLMVRMARHESDIHILQDQLDDLPLDKSIAIDATYKTPWKDLKKMMTEEYYPRNELQKMEKKFSLPVKKVPTARRRECHCHENCTAGKSQGITICKDSIPQSLCCFSSKYKTAQVLWAAILKTFGGNKATKKTKKNLLKQQYGNFKAEGSETLEQTFNRLQVIVGQLQFMDVEVEHDDLNQKFLTSLALEWLMHTIVWRNMSDLDTMSLDDLYNHLKVYESKVQKKSEPNSQNMAFISSAKHSRGNEDGNSASVSTASTNVPTASANIRINEDDMEEMDIKWSMDFLSMRADKFWKKTWKKISIQGSDMDGFDKSKVECFNCHKMGHFTRECRAPKSKDKGRRDNYRQGSKVEEQVPKALMAIDGVSGKTKKLSEMSFYTKFL
nr:hypothetical protein [Tanacetum cinerariifolium]